MEPKDIENPIAEEDFRSQLRAENKMLDSSIRDGSLLLSSITDEDAIEMTKIIFSKMKWEVIRYDKHIYYLDVVEKTESKSRWRVNVFWLAEDIKLWHDSEGEESVERGGKMIFDAYRFLESKGYKFS